MEASLKKNVGILKKKKKIFTRDNIVLYFMFLPAFVYFIIFSYIPMAGVSLAFADFRVSGIKKWVGLANFDYIFHLTFFWQAFTNTWIFVLLSYLIAFPAPIILAIFLNEIKIKKYKKFVQTISTLPNFISWVVVAGIWVSLLSPSTGYINAIIQQFGGQPIYFLSKGNSFPLLLTLIRVWKEVGYSSIIYLAAIAGIDQQMYEAAVIDGAGRFKQMYYITLPSIKQIVLIIFVLSLSGVLNLFEPVYVFMNPMIQDKAQVIDTYVYQMGVVQAQYSVALAVGLFKSTISLVFVIAANLFSKKLSDDGKSII